MEGLHCFKPSSGCNMTGLILPITEYDHSQGDAVIGGYVYRGPAIPRLSGTYLFSDFESGTIWGLTEIQPVNGRARNSSPEAGTSVPSAGTKLGNFTFSTTADPCCGSPRSN